MYEAMSIAATGIKAQQKRIDTIANNVANVNTAGFKSSKMEFKDALYQAGFTPGPAYTPGANQQKGYGVVMGSAAANFKEGALEHTENTMDFAIVGDGFFEVKDSYGQYLYTRAGNMYTTLSDDGNTYLVDSSGRFIQDNNKNSIVVPQGTKNISMAPNGQITFMGNTGQTTNQLGIYTFDNKSGLLSQGAGCYVPSQVSGQPQIADNIEVKQGYLEASNVNLANEMTLLIRSQRAFSLAARALTTADDMEGIANNIRR